MAVVRILPALLDLLLHDPVLLIQLLDVVVGLTKCDFLDGAAASTPESCKKMKKNVFLTNQTQTTRLCKITNLRKQSLYGLGSS